MVPTYGIIFPNPAENNAIIFLQPNQMQLLLPHKATSPLFIK